MKSERREGDGYDGDGEGDRRGEERGRKRKSEADGRKTACDRGEGGVEGWGSRVD